MPIPMKQDLSQVNWRFTAKQIVAMIEVHKINITKESTAHNDIMRILTDAGLEPQREVRMTAGSRVDVMVGGVAVEIKRRGSRREVWSQLERYAAIEDVDCVVLATQAAWPQPPATIHGKPFFVASLNAGHL